MVLVVDVTIVTPTAVVIVDAVAGFAAVDVVVAVIAAGLFVVELLVDEMIFTVDVVAVNELVVVQELITLPAHTGTTQRGCRNCHRQGGPLLQSPPL